MADDRASYLIERQAAATPVGVQPPAGLYVTAEAGRQSATKGANTFEAVPFVVGIPMWFSGVAVNVTGTGNKVRPGIYADSGNGQPGTLLVDFGQVDVSTTGIKTITSAFVLPVGLWWVGAVAQSASVGLSCYSGALRPVGDATLSNVAGQAANGYQMTGVTGGLPASFTIAGVGASCAVVGLLTA